MPHVCTRQGNSDRAPEHVGCLAPGALQEILSDARVVASQLGGRGGRVRDEKETATAKSITVTNDGREKAVAPKEAIEAAEKAAEEAHAPSNGNGAAAPAPAPAADEVPANVREAREWIRLWRAKQLESKLPADSTV